MSSNTFAASFVASGLAEVVTLPVDITKIRLQLQVGVFTASFCGKGVGGWGGGCFTRAAGKIDFEAIRNGRHAYIWSCMEGADITLTLSSVPFAPIALACADGHGHGRMCSIRAVAGQHSIVVCYTAWAIYMPTKGGPLFGKALRRHCCGNAATPRS